MAFSWSSLVWAEGRYTMDRRRAESVERTLAIARAIIVGMSMVGTLVGGSHPEELAVAADIGLAAYFLASLAYALYVHLRSVDLRWLPAVHVADIGLTALITTLTGGPASPVFAVYVFLLLAAAYRWGRRETLLTGLVTIVTLVAQASFFWGFGIHQVYPPTLVIIRLTYFSVGTLLIGTLAAAERRSGRVSQAIARVMSQVRADAGVIGSVQAVLDEFLSQLAAPHAVLVLDEEGSDRVFIWQADATSRRGVRVLQERRGDARCYTFPVPQGADAWLAERSTPAGVEVVTPKVLLDPEGHRTSLPLDLSPLVSAPLSWKTVVGVASMAGEGWTGRLFIFDPSLAGSPHEELQFLQSLTRGVGPALFNLYLQRRLASRTGVIERARISRELHDGVIQSLVGIEMQLEVMRRESGNRLPETVLSQLTNIQALLSQEILNVRDLMQLLRPVEVDARRLVEHLAEVLDRFRHRTGIDARLVCHADEIDLSPRACRELSSIVQEALANVRKHSGASDVLVRLEAQGSGWRLEIDDNGKGFDFDGHFDHEELDALRRGPVIIKERIRALGGRLAIHSQPGFGARLEITIPGKRHV